MAIEIPTAQSGIAMIYESVLQKVMERFAQIENDRRGTVTKSALTKFKKSKGKAPLPILKREEACRICRHAAETEASYLEVLITHFDESELRNAFDKSFGLCLPHFDLLIARHPDDPNLNAILEAQLKKCERLHAELKEYIRRLDYRFAGLAPGAEKGCWLRALEMLAGKAGLFGNQIVRTTTRH
jgi:hypothetical protein